mgnify:CR=1 FL=1
MGNKSYWTGQLFLRYSAISIIFLALISVNGCAPVNKDTAREVQISKQLQKYKSNLTDGFYDTIVQQSRKVVADGEKNPSAEVAFYALGEIYAHTDYSGKDYDLSQYYFEKLIGNFPESSMSAEAKLYLGLFETIKEKEKMAKSRKPVIIQTPSAKIIKQPSSEEQHAFVSENIVENLDFEEAARKNTRIIEQVGRNKPADAALYNLGLIYAHVNNPAKDYKKSEIYFTEITKQFPYSSYAEEAQVWLGVFETIKKIQQIDVEFDQQLEQLSE